MAEVSATNRTENDGDDKKSNIPMEPHILRTHERQAKEEEERQRVRELDEKPIKFSQQRGIPAGLWIIVSIICLVLFVIALICFYAAPSSREFHVKTYIIVRDLAYKDEYADENTVDYQTLTHNTGLSFERALQDIAYDRIVIPIKPRHAIRYDPLGLLLVVDIYFSIYATPVEMHELREEKIELFQATLPELLQPTYLGSLQILQLWIGIKNPPEAELVCPDVIYSTDIGSPTKRLVLPQDVAPEVEQINGETPSVRRINLAPSNPVELFPVGTTPVSYRVIYTNVENGGAMAECTFEITIEDTELPSLECPPTNMTRTGADLAWDVNVRDNVSDESKITVTSTHQSGDSIPTDTVIALYATDEAGNVASCLFTAEIS